MERYRLRKDTLGRPIAGRVANGGPRFGNPNGTRGKGHHRGRPHGSPNKASKEIRAKAAESGELPHEFALRVMRLGPGKTIMKHEITWDDVKWAVITAAPFYAPKMSATQHSGPNNGPIPFAHIDPHMLAKAKPEELLILERFFGRLQEGGDTHDDTPNVSDAEAEAYARTLN